MKKSRKWDDSGFSLVEVIIAMTILVLVALPLMKYFTDSLKISYKMGVKQRTTALCQQTVEQLKAEDTLVAVPEGETAYSCPYLLSEGFRVVKDSNTMDGDGIGNVKLVKTVDTGMGKYDVVVELSTTVGANEVKHPIIYGIDDTKDILIVEQQQLDEAIMYFRAVHGADLLDAMMSASPSPDPDESPSPSPAASPSPDPGASPSPTLPPHGLDWLDGVAGEGEEKEAQIRINMERHLTKKIYIDLDYEESTGVYTVQAYYKYWCTDISSEPLTSGYLANVRTDDLSTLYLLYNRQAFDPGRPLLASGNKDEIEMKVSSTVPKLPELILICQNFDPNESVQENYGLSLNVTDPEPEEGELQTIRSNILNTEHTGNVTGNWVGYDYSTIKPITGEGRSVRIVKLEVSVYDEGACDPDDPPAALPDPYIVVSTTKGE